MPSRKAVAVARLFSSLAAILVAVVFALPAPAPVSAAPPEGLAKKIDAIIDGPDYKHATWGAFVVDAKTGETVYSRNPDSMLAPASVTKLFSCAAALVTFGPDHTCETAVYRRGLVFKGVL